MKYPKELLPDKLYQHTYNGDYDYSEGGDGTTIEIQRLNSVTKTSASQNVHRGYLEDG